MRANGVIPVQATSDTLVNRITKSLSAKPKLKPRLKRLLERLFRHTDIPCPDGIEHSEFALCPLGLARSSGYYQP